jgi:hypothetical protein
MILQMKVMLLLWVILALAILNQLTLTPSLAQDGSGSIEASEGVVISPSFDVSNEVLAEPPQFSAEVREQLEEVLRKTHLPGPVIPVAEDVIAIPSGLETEVQWPGDVTSTEPQAPNDFRYFRAADLGAGAPTSFTSIVNEPSVGNDGNVVFYSGNWYAAISTDGGNTFNFFNPFTGPGPSVNGGFCCDQIVISDPSRDAIF